jgi:hypothetical protein
MTHRKVFLFVAVCSLAVPLAAHDRGLEHNSRADLRLATTVAVSHVHVAQPDVNGGVTVFFGGGGGRRAYPPRGVVSGDFPANDVIGLATQQLEAQNLAKLLAARRAGRTYVNAHTATSPGGEIPGQIHDDDHKH